MAKLHEANTQGATIRYGDEGMGEPALLLLPGWCSGREVFDRVLPHLRAHRRVLSPDLRGHGASENRAGDFGFRELADDAEALLARSGAARVVPVAVSHAGWVALELRRRLRDRVPGIVLVDWIVTPPPPPFAEALRALQDPRRVEGAVEGLFARWLEGVDDAGVEEFVREGIGSAPREMWMRAGREIEAAYAREGSPLEAIARLDGTHRVLHLYGQPRDAGYLEAQREHAKRVPQFDVERLPSRGHFPTLEASADVAARIERFVATLAPTAERAPPSGKA